MGGTSGDVCLPSGVSVDWFCKAEMILILQLRLQNK